MNWVCKICGEVNKIGSSNCLNCNNNEPNYCEAREMWWSSLQCNYGTIIQPIEEENIEEENIEEENIEEENIEEENIEVVKDWNPLFALLVAFLTIPISVLILFIMLVVAKYGF